MGAACCNGESFSTEASQAHLRRNRRKSQQLFAVQHTSHLHTTVSTSPSHTSPRLRFISEAMSSATDASSTNFVEITTMTGGSGTSWPAVKIIFDRFVCCLFVPARC
ncbi:Hypothetical protein, putative [Bodo saltans]|uniref:Uncharacterized protein n=1 Tax=Bodo saltans TaxID=75058 RepID=A0A0S4KMU3_BODSA|nr:Hypothetical protein, putative [Bodo saltans]|eukprot:CUI14971.1 Hypothetical protein, putative [Bodo saltans]